jgi:hypothetical protein
MEFLRPGGLWLLALALPLVLLHLRWRRRVRVVVPSLLAFDPATLGAAPPRALGLLPRDLLALLLALGALAGLSLAAAGPVVGAEAVRARGVAIVIDGSASTLAAGRFDEERDIARRILDAVGPATPVTLILAAGEPRVLASLDGARPRAVGGGALRASAEAALRSGGEVFVLTDGCDREPLPDGVTVVSVGRAERNRGIAGYSLDLRRGSPPSLVLAVVGEDGERTEEDRSAEPGPPCRVSLPGGDALAADDALTIRAEAPRPLRVAVVGKADPWLTAALEACGGVVDPAVSVTVDPAGLANLAAAPDVLVGPAVDSPLAALVLGAGDGEAMEAPTVLGGDRQHPVLRGVDPTEWIVTRARTLSARAGDAVLLQGPRGPLALARPGRILLGFEPSESTLPLSGSWPVFVRNALLWLAGDPPAPTAEGLLDAAESDLRPRVPRNADAFVPPSRPSTGEGPRSLAPLLAAAAALLLLAEWWVTAPRRESLGAPAPAS